ncbi:MAG: hypothetical protein WC227_02190 [Patescibacteria group bacterium]|jgi:hypothetical protein
MEKLNKNGFLNAFGILVYVVLVATLMQNGDRLFGQADNFVSPIAFLLLFSLSATIVGGLMLGKPLMLYFDGKKKEAVSLFLATSGWLAGFTILAFFVIFLIK